MKLRSSRAMIGGTAAAEFLRQLNPDVMAAYPITPQTPIIETFAKMKADGVVETEIIPVESEHSAMSATLGAAAAGARAVTATSSQGLALMHEVLYATSGMRLPVLMFVSARALSAPLNIHGEHGDVMGSRDAGWIQIFSESVQDVYENAFVSLRVAETVKLPVMVVMDGFHTSHTTERIDTIPENEAKKFLGQYDPEKYLLNTGEPVTFGPLALQNSYMDFKIAQHEAFQKVPAVFKKVAGEFNKQFRGLVSEIEPYRLADADRAIVIMGSTAGTAKVVVDKLREQRERVGLLKINLFRPFPNEAVRDALKNVEKIAVLDRAISLGAKPPLFSDVVSSLSEKDSAKHEIQGYIYGLGGHDTYERQIEDVYRDLNEMSGDNKIRFIK